MTNKFSLKEIFKSGFEDFKKYWATVIVLYIILTIVSIVLSTLTELISGMPKMTSTFGMSQFDFDAASMFSISMYIVLTLVSSIITYWMSYNMMKSYFKLIDGHKVEVKEIFNFNDQTVKNVLMWFVGGMVYSIICIVGFILLIIPGIYLSIKLMFAPYLILDKGLGIEEAFRRSWSMTDGHFWDIFLFGLATIGMVLLGLLLLIVGVIPAVIIILFATLRLYRKLEGTHHVHHAVHALN
jgi:uncharacterized membrane protein